MNNKGSVALMSALLVVPIMMSVGLAVDLSSLWVLRQRMQWAVDTAALLGASQSNSETGDLVTKDAKELFWASYGAPLTTYIAGTQVGFLGSSSAGATVTPATAASGNTPANPYVTVTASATLPTMIMRFFPKIGAGYDKNTVTVTSTTAVPHRVEMALALDNSLSMGLPISGASNKLAALQAAANNMITTILGSGSQSSPNVSMAIVPFAGAVNVGNDSVGQSFLKSGTLNANFPTGTAADLGWRGCVQARAYAAPSTSYDTTEDAPSSDTTKFDPYFYASTYHVHHKNNGKGNGNGDFDQGDNDWHFGVDKNNNVTAIYVNDTNTAPQTTNTNYLSPSGLYYGPNLFCPHSSLVKLTNDKTALSNAINNMALVNGGGTIVNQGLQWGWFAVSPLWTAWNLPPSPTGAARPASYSDNGTTKVIVLMTDGENGVDGIDTYYGAASDGNRTNCNQIPNIYPECFQVDSWYTSYQRVSSGVLTNSGTDSDSRRRNAVIELNSRLQTLCTNIKNANQQNKIVLYTIFYHGSVDDYLGLSGAASTLLQSCATDANHYFDSSSASAINAAFQKIAQDINDLRVTK